MELKDTVEMMTSLDHRERFRAEYLQTKLRYQRLHQVIVRYEAGKLDFRPLCSIQLLKEQKAAMGQYLYYLEVRAVIEDIDLK